MSRESAFRLLAVMLAALPLVLGGAGSWGCGRTYSQATPEDVLKSARAMVENGDVHRLPDLIYAESDELRRLLTQSGRVLTSLQELAIELNRAFPEEIAEIRAEAAAAAERGESSNFVGRMLGGGQRSGMQARGRRGATRPGMDGSGASDMQRSLNQSIRELFADPYGWLERSEGRISTQIVSDDMAAILWDGKPAFGVGLLMKEEGGKWYILPPTMFPGAGQFMPSSPETWQIAGSLVQALDNAIKDTRREVRRGEHASLEDLGRSVGEKAALPAIAIYFAYERAMQEQRREERQRRQQATEAAARESGGS